jgi:HEAT repeat protein
MKKTQRLCLGMFFLAPFMLAAAATPEIPVNGVEAQPIGSLLRENKIEVQANGNDIQRVSVKVRRLVSDPLAVLIPAGALFVSNNPAAQNMVTTAKTRADILTDDWVKLDVSVACANMTKAIPGANDSFTIASSPSQAELASVMSVLEKTPVHYPIRQAAVWIVTDDADYGALGRLTHLAGPRVIGEKEAIAAMKICEDARIDLQQKAIWKHDPELIFCGLVLDQQTQDWCLAMAAKLGYHGSREDVLISALRGDPSAEVRESAVRLLAELGESRAIEPLIAALDDSDSSVSLAALRALSTFRDARSVKALIGILQTSDNDAMVSDATRCLVEFADPQCIDPLIALLKGKKSVYIQNAAVQILGKLGDPRAADSLFAVLKDKRKASGTRLFAADALGQLNDPRWFEPLVGMLKSRDRHVRDAVYLALGQSGDPRAFDPLNRAMTDRDAHIRELAVTGLGQLGDPRGFEPLVGAMSDEDARVREATVGALGELADPRAIDPLIAALNAENGGAIARLAAQALGQSGDPRALEPLIAALKGPDKSLGIDAARGLGELGDSRAVQPLMEALSTAMEALSTSTDLGFASAVHDALLKLNK